MGKRLTPYFIFSGEHRSRVKEKLLAERGGGKVSVGDVAKEIGFLWGQLTEEEKKKYKDAAVEMAAKNPPSPTEGDGVAKKELPAMLPLSLVKKVVCRDEEVKRVSGDAVRVIAEATGMFIGLLASKSHEYAKGQKRKNFKFSDIESVARGDSRMREIGLSLSFEYEDVFVQMKQRRVEGVGASGSGSAKKKKKKKGKTLHSFFAPRAAGTEKEGEGEGEGDPIQDGDAGMEEEEQEAQQVEVVEEEQMEEEQQVEVVEEEEGAHQQQDQQQEVEDIG